MNIKIIIITAFTALTGCVIATTHVSSPKQTIEVISLKEISVSLQMAAQKWDKDAYLLSVEIPIFARPEENYLWQAAAIFQSANKKSETVVVTLELDGDLSSRPVSHSTNIYQVPKIEQSDWSIDSQEALVYFQSSGVIEDSRLSSGRASLFLERILSIPNQPVVWRLSTGMSSPEGRHYFLDPLTGMILEISQ